MAFAEGGFKSCIPDIKADTVEFVRSQEPAKAEARAPLISPAVAQKVDTYAKDARAYLTKVVDVGHTAPALPCAPCTCPSCTDPPCIVWRTLCRPTKARVQGGGKSSSGDKVVGKTSIFSWVVSKFPP